MKKKAEKFYTTKDVAHILDCCPDDIGDYLRRGILKGKLHGRRWHIRPGDLARFKPIYRAIKEGRA